MYMGGCNKGYNKLYKNGMIKDEACVNHTIAQHAVYAPPPVRRLRVPQNHVRANALCAVLLQHILPALVFASQSPEPGWQNVIYSETLYAICPKQYP